MPIRVQLSRKKGWRMPPNTVKVSRPGKWGNRFRLGDAVMQFGGYTEAGERNVARVLVLDTTDKVVAWYERWLRLALAQHPEIVRPALDELRGKNLACWCAPVDKDGKPVPCHADVLLRVANETAP